MSIFFFLVASYPKQINYQSVTQVEQTIRFRSPAIAATSISAEKACQPMTATPCGIMAENQTERITNIETLINERLSVRAFQDKPVTPETLKAVFDLAVRAPSWKNAQGYRVVAVTGERKKKLAEELTAEAKKGELDRPHIPYDKGAPPEIKKRMFNLGMDFYAHLGIDRKDKEAREAQMLENFKGFGAPMLVFFYIPEKLAAWTILDLGIFLGHFALVAGQHGLGTCFQATMAAYPDIVAKYSNPPEGHKLMVGLSLGYPDKSAKINQFKTSRLGSEELLTILD